MTRAELVFIPSPGRGHLVSAVEMAKLLADRDQRLYVTVLIIKMPFDFKTDDYEQSVPKESSSRIRFLHLSHDESLFNSASNASMPFFARLVDAQKPRVREIAARIADSASSRLAGFVVDMFCTALMEVADEFGVPSYVFFTSSAAFLGLSFHLQYLRDHQKKDLTKLKDSDPLLSVPCFSNPLPANVLPSVFLTASYSEMCAMFLGIIRRMKQSKGIMVNTFLELEPQAVYSLSDAIANTPPVYPVGPLLNLHGSEESGQYDAVMRWLDDQPPSSVVFLCFGSMGSFGEAQVKEIANALERSGYRFLWSLRRPSPKGNFQTPGEYENPEEVLPEGFLERTAKVGKVIGWAPQVAVLSHAAVGGFVSHCGWNSTLESVWCGVPMATWPLYAEQQMNAFMLVRELEMAVDISIDYRKEEEVVLKAEEIESGIRRLMAEDGDIMRKKVEAMKEKSRAALMEGGSSYTRVGRFIDDVIQNVPSC